MVFASVVLVVVVCSGAFVTLLKFTCVDVTILLVILTWKVVVMVETLVDRCPETPQVVISVLFCCGRMTALMNLFGWTLRRLQVTKKLLSGRLCCIVFWCSISCVFSVTTSGGALLTGELPVTPLLTAFTPCIR